MEVHVDAQRFFPALPILLGALLGGCQGEPPTEPTSPAATPTAGSTAALIGAPNTWEEVAPMPSARHSTVAGAAVNANGRSILYVFGGMDVEDEEGIGTFGSVEAYNIANDRWATKGAVAPVETSAINGAGNIGGKFYLPGGGVQTGNGFLKLRVLQSTTRPPTPGPGRPTCPGQALVACPA
jgi:hypothetical protein